MRRHDSKLFGCLTATLLALMGSSASWAQENGHQWSQLPPLPDRTGFAGPFAGVSGEALLVAGGANFPGGRPWDGHKKVWHDRIFLLDKPEGIWRELDRKLPAVAAYGVSINTRNGLLCIGGGNAKRHSRDVLLLRWTGKKLQIERMPPLPRAAAFFCGALVGKTVYVAGGIERPDSPRALHTFWALDLSQPADERRWRSLKPWPGPARILAVAATRDDAFYLLSGATLDPDQPGDNKRVYLRDAYRYTPKDGWTKIARLPRPVVAAPTPAVPVGAAGLMVIGGDDGALATKVTELKDRHPGFPADLLVYDTKRNTWTSGGRFPKKVGDDPARHPNRGLWPPVTTPTVRWADHYVLPSGEVRPGVRTPRVVSLRVKTP